VTGNRGVLNDFELVVNLDLLSIPFEELKLSIVSGYRRSKSPFKESDGKLLGLNGFELVVDLNGPNVARESPG
jgi:hypothetical protein